MKQLLDELSELEEQQLYIDLSIKKDDLGVREDAGKLYIRRMKLQDQVRKCEKEAA